MRKQLLAAAGALTLGFAGFVSGTAITGAEAQSAQKPPVILIVNREAVVAQTKAGKTIPDQAEKLKSSVEKELQREADKLKKEIEDFQKNASLMSDEVRQQKQQELAVRERVALPQRVQIMEQAYTAAVQNAQAKILIESQPILKEIVESRGATILLDRSAVMYAAPETDITQQVIAQIDKKMKSVEVQKVSLAEIEKQLAEAQKAQNGKKK